MIVTTLFVLAVLSATSIARPEADPRMEDEESGMHPRIKANKKTEKFKINSDEYETSYWNELAHNVLASKLTTQNKNIAKNVIMFLGDGMSISTLKAARVLMGQLEGKDGEGSQLAMEKFPYSGLSKTYCLESQVPDSACTATAYLCGVKANSGTIGVGGQVMRGNCESSKVETNRVNSIASWSQAAGKRTGLVTTTRVTHASPAGVYAHVPERGWESDYDTDDSECEDIAYQLVHGETGKNLNVAMGGGRRNFIPRSIRDEERKKGRRRDHLNLIDEWLESKKGLNATYVFENANLKEAAEKSDYLLGLFQSSHMKFYLDAMGEDPTLEEMTEAAIKVLSKGDKGYFLFVEGGKIDTAHHENKPQKSLHETIEFSKAIQKAKNLTSEEDTLIVVTSDHSHVFTIGGYADRGSSILGIAGEGDDEIPYTILSYANGPGYRKEVKGSRYDFSKNNFSDKDLAYPALARKRSETHSGEDVGIFASGPWAHLFSGVIEQSVIPHIMAYASCVGGGATACD